MPLITSIILSMGHHNTSKKYLIDSSVMVSYYLLDDSKHTDAYAFFSGILTQADTVYLTHACVHEIATVLTYTATKKIADGFLHDMQTL